MVLDVLCRFLRVVEVNRAVILMMVADMLVMQEFVCNCAAVFANSLSPLHGETLQRQANHQQ